MQLLAHRGLWHTPEERNTETAIRRALAAGFGIETDLRDQDGRLVISHDPPTGAVMEFDKLLDIYSAYSGRSRLALNVKADGLQAGIKAALDARGIDNYVMFDMSVPDLLGYRRARMPFYCRRSEYEHASQLDEHAAGIWLDSFDRPFADAEAIEEAAAATRGDVALVSPELHSKPYHGAWAAWRSISKRYLRRFWLCTDFPEEAESYFSGK